MTLQRHPHQDGVNAARTRTRRPPRVRRHGGGPRASTALAASSVRRPSGGARPRHVPDTRPGQHQRDLPLSAGSGGSAAGTSARCGRLPRREQDALRWRAVTHQRRRDEIRRPSGQGLRHGGRRWRQDERLMTSWRRGAACSRRHARLRHRASGHEVTESTGVRFTPGRSTSRKAGPPHPGLVERA